MKPIEPLNRTISDWLKEILENHQDLKGLHDLLCCHGDLICRYMEFLNISGALLDPNNSDAIISTIKDFCGKTKRKKIILYPANEITRKIAEGNDDESFMDLIAVVDKDHSHKEPVSGLTVISPDDQLLTTGAFDHIVITSFSYGQEMKEYLIQKMNVPSEKILTLDLLKKAQQNGDLTDIYSSIAAFSQREKRIILFCYTFPYVNYPRFVALRKAGWHITLVSISPILTKGPVDYELGDGFDSAISLTVEDALCLLSNIKSGLLLTLDTLCHNFLCLLAHLVFKGPAVHEIYDLADNVPYHFEERQIDLFNRFGYELNEIETNARKILYNISKGIIYRESPKAMDDLIKNTGTNRPSLHFLPYGDMIPIERPSQNQKKETFSIIHCGVVPCNLQLKTLSQTILGLVPPVVEQGIQFHIINPDDPDNILNKEFEKGISQDCRQYFRYLSPLYNHQFTRLLSSYSAGWMVFSFNEKRRTAPRYLNTFSSRLLSYLSAGLPVFISPEFEFMADLCREYGVGIILKSSDVMDLSAIIDDTDWDTLNRNVLAVRRLFSIEKQLPRFDQFITAFLN